METAVTSAEGSLLAAAVDWLAGIDRLPPDVETRARILVLDSLGCIVAGLAHPDVQAFGRSLGTAFPGTLKWPGSDQCLGPAGIAALGATAACWDEACEGNASAHGRPGLPVVPAVLALGASGDIDFGGALLALVTGYEIGARAGEAWRIPQGWHVDGSWHALGVAGAVARLNGGPERILAATEVAACQIPASLYLPISRGSVVRNTYPAHAVLLGVMAAAAATAGYQPPLDALAQGRRTVLRATSPAVLTPAGRWTILEGYLKPFAGVRHTHYGVEAALRLRRLHAIDAAAITGIRLHVYPEAVQYCANRSPKSAIAAQFSLTYTIAAALVLGDLGPEAYARLHDPRIERLERIIEIEPDTTIAGRGATVTIDVGGRHLSQSVGAIAGDATCPLAAGDVAAKFRRYAAPVLGEDRARALENTIMTADLARPVRTCLSFSG